MLEFDFNVDIFNLRWEIIPFHPQEPLREEIMKASGEVPVIRCYRLAESVRTMWCGCASILPPCMESDLLFHRLTAKLQGGN